MARTGSKERMRRVDEQLRQVLSEAIQGLSDPRLGFITVTGVRTTPDLEHATVFVQVLGSESRRAKGLDALESARGALQERVGRELRVRRVPRLQFSYDESLDRGLRIEALIERLGPPVLPEDVEEADEEAGADAEPRG
jgi:ribosome-binding factor A